MFATTDSMISVPAAQAAPSQLALDNLTETLAALLDEAMALLGVTDKYTAMGELCLTRVPAAIFHAFPQPVLYVEKPNGVPRDGTWKRISTSGRGTMTIWCDHRAACPDLPENAVAADHSAASHGTDYGSFLTCTECAPDREPAVDGLELVRLPNDTHAWLRPERQAAS